MEVDTNHYSVPWRYLGQEVTVRIERGLVLIFRAGKEIARHDESALRRARCMDSTHLNGLSALHMGRPSGSELERPLAEYEAVIGGL